MSVIKLQSPLTSTATGVKAELQGGYSLQIDPLEKWLCRVAIVPAQGLSIPNTWMIAPQGDVPWSGRPRLDTTTFSCPDVSFSDDQITSDFLEVDIQKDPLALSFRFKSQAGWHSVFDDRRMAAYRYLPQRAVFQHAQTRSLDAMHLGLGDKAGPLDRTGRRFRCLQTDALGYNAETSDPLYKHVPWLIVGNSNDGYCGIFYDTMAECAFDLGAEHSNYYGYSRSVEVYENALVYYLVFGPSLSDIVPRFQKLTGLPHLQPRWASGFALTSMHHADADNAQDVMLDFVNQCRERELPISAYHSGSGYTTREDGRRYVFTWNEKKFPQRDKFFQQIQQAGLYTCANIKPVLLKEHPLFGEVEDFGGFIANANGEPAIEMFWGGPGASLDFTNPQTVTWWQEGVKEQVLGAGFTSTWNDNNECEIWDEQAKLNGFGSTRSAMDMRPIQAILMTRASFEASKAVDSVNRPYTITRAGPVGISRYAQTWSGDNTTSWHTLRWNLANGLSMSLSAFPLVGHDIGGFVGPKPDAELLCRWFEMMALHPRAVMNSWKPEEPDPASTPWMHESVADLIRDVLTLRYRFLPLLYHLGWCAHVSGTPIITPMLYYFNDESCRQDLSQFMLGEDVLVAPVTEPGVTQRMVYLPRSDGGWYQWQPEDVNAKWYEGGESVSVMAPLGSFPLFVRAGAILPISTDWQKDRPHEANAITVTCFLPPGKMQSNATLFYDDGLSWKYQKQSGANIFVDIVCEESNASIKLTELWREANVSWQLATVGLGGRVVEM